MSERSRTTHSSGSARNVFARSTRLRTIKNWLPRPKRRKPSLKHETNENVGTAASAVRRAKLDSVHRNLNRGLSNPRVQPPLPQRRSNLRCLDCMR